MPLATRTAGAGRKIGGKQFMRNTSIYIGKSARTHPALDNLYHSSNDMNRIAPQALASALAPAAASTALVQESPPLDDITVTATGFEQAMAEAPIGARLARPAADSDNGRPLFTSGTTACSPNSSP
ncbi:MAG: hypothetical protein ACLFRS_10135 [Halomonas sp.]